MTIEQEVREEFGVLFHHSVGEELWRITKALKAKQDRIETLESALKEIIDLEHYDSLKDDTQELMVNLAKKALGGASCE